MKTMNDWDMLDEGAINDVPDSPGVYMVRCVQCGRPAVIPRAFKKDERGILCFGMAGDHGLRHRLSTLLKAVSEGCARHSEGKTYYKCRYDDTGYPQDSLEFIWLRLRTEKQAKWREKDWLGKYEESFGELPPLNKRCG